MNSQNKNILIGGLLAIVLVMAVGYAAFATQLNITGTASISSNWDVHFDKAACTGYTDQAGCAANVAAAKTFAGGSLPTGTLFYGSGNAPLTATVHADLNQPGDSVTFTLDIINAGSLNATAAAPTLSGTGFTINGLTATKGNIKFTVTAPATNPLPHTTGNTTTMTVKAEFIDTHEAVEAHCEDYDGQTAPATEEACTTANGTWVPAQAATTGNTQAQNSGELTIALNYTQS